MNHSHSFSRTADGVRWEEEQMIVERNCEHRVKNSTPGTTLSGGISMSGSEEYCSATKENVYELWSLVDYHNYHDCEFTSIRLREEDSDGDDVHITDFETPPEWVTDLQERVAAVVDERDVGLFMTHMGGAEIPITIVTSDTEYNAIFTLVDERIIE